MLKLEIKIMKEMEQSYVLLLRCKQKVENEKINHL